MPRHLTRSPSGYLPLDTHFRVLFFRISKVKNVDQDADEQREARESNKEIFDVGEISVTTLTVMCVRVSASAET